MTVEEKTCQLATLYGYKRVAKDELPTPAWKQELWKDGIANIDEHLNGLVKTQYSYPFSKHAEAINTVQRWFIEETRLGIPVDFSNEGIHGLNHDRATPLPAPIAIGSTWNAALVRQAGEIVGREAKALGYTNVYAPILDLARDPRWGRVLECYGEEPFHVTTLGKEMVAGIQSQGVAATLKHFAVYSVPKGGRDGHARTDPHVAPREMHQLHLYPYRKIIREVHPMGVMSSYNDWDGIPVSGSYYFLTELLREKYGFDGYVVSDSEAVEFVYSKHRVAQDMKGAVKQVVEAGLNVKTNFTQPSDFVLPLRELVAEGSYHPTYFEMLFLMGMVIFAEAGVDYVTLETGLGGRMDATTAVENPVACVITSISLDHMQYLGDTVAKIAGEKAGIIVPGVPVIYDGNDPDAAEVIRARAEELGSPAYEVKRSDTEVLRNTSAGIDFAFRNEYYKDMVFSIPFIAKYQVMNSALALKTIEVLQNVISVSMDQIHVGIAGTRWQGRMETVLPGVIVDGAHNEDGVEKFVETAEHFQKECPLTLLFSAVDDKDYTDMIHTICSRITFRQVVVTSVGGYRQVPAERFAKLFTEAGASSVEVVEDVEKAFGRALEVKGDDGMLFCVGSLYLVGEIKDVIRRNKK